MKTFKSTWWILTLPDDWHGQSDAECITFSKPDSTAVLQISAFQKTTAVTQDDLHEFAVDDLREARSEEVTLGTFKGVTFPSVSGHDDMRVWYLMSGKLMVSATYVYEDIDDIEESEEIERILTTLRAVKK